MSEKKIIEIKRIKIEYNPEDKYAFQKFENDMPSFPSHSITHIQNIFNNQRTIADARQFAIELGAVSTGGIEFLINSKLFPKTQEDRIVREFNNTREIASKIYTALLDYR